MGELVLGGVVYPTQKQAKARCRDLVASVGVGEAITDPADLAFLRDLIARHPDAAGKVGAGIRAITVRVNTPFRTLGFWIERVDGTRTDISWLECLSPSNNRQKVLTALRHAIVDQRSKVKAAAFAAGPVFCPYTGERLTPDNAHADHAPPWTFERIADEFAKSEGGWAQIQHASHDGALGSELVDNQQRLRWRRFHASRADLRVVSEIANLSIIPREARDRSPQIQEMLDLEDYITPCEVADAAEAALKKGRPDA